MIWPAILIGRGDTILPYDVPANEYMNFGGQKASKSAGIGTTVPDLLKAFDPDPIRYYLTANAPENSDSDFSSDELIRRNNDELVAAWGNLVNRTLTFTQRYFDGKVPGDGTTDPALAAEIEKTFETVTALLESARFKETIGEVMALARVGNRFFDERAPWRQVKEDHDEAGKTIGSMLNLINALKVLFAPFLPFTSAKLHGLLGYEDSLESHGWRVEPLAPGDGAPEAEPAVRQDRPEHVRRDVTLSARTARLLLVPILLAYGYIAFGYARGTPRWNNPDEPAHVNVIRQIATTGTLPVLTEGDWDKATLDRLTTAWFPNDYEVDGIRYEGHQPPLYYLLAAPVHRLTANQPLNRQILALRLFSAAIGAIAVIAAFVVAREAAPERPVLAVLTAATVAFVPMNTAISAAVNNDCLATALAAVTLAALMVGRRRGFSDRWAMGLGVLIGALILTKLTVYVFVPLILATLFAAGRTLTPVLSQRERESSRTPLADVRAARDRGPMVGWLGLGVGATSIRWPLIAAGVGLLVSWLVARPQHARLRPARSRWRWSATTRSSSANSAGQPTTSKRSTSSFGSCSAASGACSAGWASSSTTAFTSCTSC